MATTAATHPHSLLQPSWYGIDFSRRSSSQRPFSLALTSEARSHRSSASASDVGQAHYSATMGFIIRDNVPNQIQISSHSRPRTPLPEVTNRDPLTPVENDKNQGSPKRTNRFLTASLQRAKKKRSISSFFSSNGDALSIAMALDMVSTPIAAMVNDRPPSTPPAVTKRVSVVPEEMQSEERAARFQQKNQFLMKNGMKHHPYPHEAPYMQAYDSVLIDNDRFTEILLQRLNSNGSPTFHDYGMDPPLNVLDLGCGHGRWVAQAATTWKSFGTRVTGFDLVDVSGHSWKVDGGWLDNVTWVQGNFLNRQLPFADNSFDLVRMANLSLAIPQDSWLPVLSEVRRILSPEGRLELIDDQILFPYNKSPPPKPLPTPQCPSQSPQFGSSFEMDSDEDMTGANVAAMLADEPNHLKHHLSQTPQEQHSPQLASADWEARADNSKGLETIFENMLLKKYGIHPRPQDVIDIVLGRVFGHEHADQIKTMHLALAPADLAGQDKLVDPVSAIGQDIDGKIQLTNGQPTEVNHNRPERPRRPTHSLSFESGNISSKAADLLGIGIPDKPNGDNKRPRQLPETISVKAVGRLKVYPSMKWKGKWSESVRGRRASMESLHSEMPESISPKAAGRLGVTPADRRSWGSQRSQESQSSETKRADRPSGDRTCRKDFIPDKHSVKATDCSCINPSLDATQSPGLILWPSTFIPVEPLELEMHACKHMHVLLGCKAALSAFIQDVKGPDGRAHISQNELNDLMWEYECFRRKRFHWPAELPNSRLSFASSPITAKSGSVLSDTSFGHSSTSSAPDSSPFRQLGNGFVDSISGHHYQTNVSCEPTRRAYDREDLTFVRAFRVYEAYNISKL